MAIDTCYVCGEKFQVGDSVVVVIEAWFGIQQIGEKVVAHVRCAGAELEKCMTEMG